MHMLLRIAYTLFFLVLYVHCFAQSTTLQGQVLDAEGTPLAMTFVEVLGARPSSTTTNGKGHFAVQVEAGDSLRFSFIGFASQTVSAWSEERMRRIVLLPQVEGLAVAEVVGLKAETVLDRLLENLPSNHQQGAGYHTGFYRMTGKQGERYLQVSEALLGVDATADGAEILRTRSVRDEGQLGELSFGVTTETVAEFDIACHPEAFEPFQKKYRKHHRYWLSDALVLVDGRPAYQLHFDAPESPKKAAWKGHVLVDTATYALAYVDYDFSPKTLHLLKFGDAGTRAALSLMGIEISQSSSLTQTRYQRGADGVWRLITVSSKADLEVTYTREQRKFQPYFHTRYAVTGHERLDLEAVKSGRGKLIESTTADADDSFWEAYTIVAPEVDYATVATELEARNAANEWVERLDHAQHTWPEEQRARLDSALAWFEREAGFQGLVLVAKHDQVLKKWSTVGDVSDLTFAIGSIAKSFTALTALQLEAEGVLSLDETARDFLGEQLPKDAPLGPLTLRQLLTHRAGLDHGLDHPEVVLALADAAHHWDRVALVCGDPILPADEAFRYSNGGYMLAAYLLEARTGKSMEQLVSERFTRPLGMTSTSFPSEEDSQGSVELEGFTYDPSWVLGAGGMRSTLDDLHRWSLALQENVGLDGGNIWKMAVTPVSDYIDWQASYGMGWMEDAGAFEVSAAHRVVYHPGTEWSNHSMLAIQPDLGYTVILVSLDGAFARYPMTDVLLSILNNR